MNIRVIEEKGKGMRVTGLPENNIVLFFGRLYHIFGFEYCVIFGPDNANDSNDSNDLVDLEGTGCQIAFCPPVDGINSSKILPVNYGYKFRVGGGVVWFGKRSKSQIYWSRKNSVTSDVVSNSHQFSHIFISL